MPDMDEGAFVLDYHMPVGTSLAQTDKVLRRVEAVLRRTPDISGYIRRTGAELGFFATEAYTGDILVSLKPRRRASADGRDLRRASARSSRPRSPSWRPSSSRWCRTRSTTWRASPARSRSRSSGPTSPRSATLAEQVGKIVEEVEGATDVNAHVYLGNPDVVIRPDSVQTARVGLTEHGRRVAAQRRALRPGGQHGPRAGPDDQDPGPLPRPRPVRPRAPGHAADQPGDGDRPLRRGPHAAAAAGIGFVPLGQLATIRTVRSPNELWRENQQPVITVSAELEKRDLGSVNRELQQKLPELKFPPGYRWELAGSYRAQQESFASLLTVLIVAAALVFLLLGFQFQSLTLPILIFLAQPVSLVSALFALWITGTPLNVSSFMGAILLIGLDVKNGIILIEYIGQLREAGVPLREALVQAGRTRFRPILMTSLCTILGLVPLALGLGPGAQMQQPLAIAVIGGLITNMLLTRLLIPVGYLVLRGGEDKVAAEG